jgi:hypothetical protein
MYSNIDATVANDLRADGYSDCDLEALNQQAIERGSFLSFLCQSVEQQAQQSEPG